LKDFDGPTWYEDEPSYGYNLFLERGMYAAAKEHNVRVMLDGHDGDTTVSHGAGYLNELARKGQWIRLARESRLLPRTYPDWSTWKAFRIHARLFACDPANPYSPIFRTLRQINRTVRRAGATPAANSGQFLGSAWVQPEFARRVGLVERRQLLRKEYVGPPITEREAHFRNLSQGVHTYALEMMDRSAGAFGIDPRYPFWDKRLAEYCLGLPARQKLRDGWGRLVMRRGLEGILPREIQWRRLKSNLGPSFLHCLRSHARERLEGVIMDEQSRLREYLDMRPLRMAFDRFTAQRSERFEDVFEDVFGIWTAVSLGLWLQRSGPC
jgi:asparagine synthase (glutamine-hydrolysing)